MLSLKREIGLRKRSIGHFQQNKPELNWREYIVKDLCGQALGTLETDQSEALCINDQGQVCGTYVFKGEKHFFLWSPEGGTSCLDLPKDVTPIKMNNRGQIIGHFLERKSHHSWN